MIGGGGLRFTDFPLILWANKCSLWRVLLSVDAGLTALSIADCFSGGVGNFLEDFVKTGDSLSLGDVPFDTDLFRLGLLSSSSVIPELSLSN